MYVADSMLKGIGRDIMVGGCCNAAPFFIPLSPMKVPGTFIGMVWSYTFDLLPATFYFLLGTFYRILGTNVSPTH